MDRRKLAAYLVVVILMVTSVSAGLILFYHGPGSAAVPDEGRTARAWVNVASIPSGTVREADRWGSVETLAGASAGTLSYYRQVAFHQTEATESVVLDGEIWCMMRASAVDAVLLRYSPEVRGPGWNISFECYSPQAGDAFDPSFGTQHIGLTAKLIDRNGTALAAVDLSYGTPDDRYVSLRDVGAGATTVLSNTTIASTTPKGPLEGYAPDRYIVSFQREGGRCVITVLHTSGVMVGQGTVDIPSGWGGPAQLVLSTTSTVLTRRGIDPSVPWSVTTYSGAWIVDNLACRGATAPYPLVGPLYEYAYQGAQVPTAGLPTGAPREGASVTIGGTPAPFNATTGRYEADLGFEAGWGKKVRCSVELDGVTVEDNISLTMVAVAEHARVSEWWNGWDWVSVFGLDDCAGPDSALTVYRGYEHPLTAYSIYQGGSSRQTLTYPYLEIALHNPHDWEGGSIKFWNDAVAQANTGASFLRNNYEYAGRWDAPSNGGQGDTYISMANPGNKATYQQLYALWQAGIRIDGRSSDKVAGSPGNHTQLGSWYDAGGYLGSGAGWYPYRAVDLMDASRSLSWDNPRNWTSAFELVDEVAENHGVLRAYGHPNRAIALPELMHWIDNGKTNYTLENWKATDGEVASYIYGRWSADLSFDAGRSDASTWSYNVSCGGAAAAGYWKVPVTIEIDLGGRAVKDIVVKDGGRTLRMSSGSLADLHGARIMDSGYDIRNGVLYVSGMWSEGSTLSVDLDDHSPVLDLGPETPMIMRAD
ncbi:MAG: hypothetical protein ISF22_09285 [Methanomassiliicoccus sp.]|nr:hypothetical protein [Methanomassiliicoccus sp.]